MPFPADPNAPGGPRRSDYVRPESTTPVRDRLPAVPRVTAERPPEPREVPLDRFPRFASPVPG